MATDQRKRPASHRKRAPGADVVERYRRPARWFHAVIYVSVLILLATGWWLLAGQEGSPSPLARLTGMSDISLHKLTGWILAGAALAGLLLGIRAVPSFVAESVRLRRSELGWFARWPAAVFTGRFGWHKGRFDPGQRILNITLILGLAVLIGSGVGLISCTAGPCSSCSPRCTSGRRTSSPRSSWGTCWSRRAYCPATTGCGGRCTSAAGSTPASRGGCGRPGPAQPPGREPGSDTGAHEAGADPGSSPGEGAVETRSAWAERR